MSMQNSQSSTIMSILQQVYGAEAEIWFQRSRGFFMACAELFGSNRGNEWFVSHYLLLKTGSVPRC